MEGSDETLADAAREGDSSAFAILLERHYDKIFGLAFRMLGSRADAEDLAQDVCFRLPAKLGSWRGESKFTTWLYRVVVNASHDERRKKETHRRAAEGWGDVELAQRATDAETAERRMWLARAMLSLSPDLRDTVALTVDLELTQSEAANVLGISEGTVAWRMSEVKKALRAMATERDAT